MSLVADALFVPLATQEICVGYWDDVGRGPAPLVSISDGGCVLRACLIVAVRAGRKLRESDTSKRGLLCEH